MADSLQPCLALLKNLRVCDLQDLLRTYGQPKSGKKQELVSRCERMLQQLNPQDVLPKIQELVDSRRGRGVAMVRCGAIDTSNDYLKETVQISNENSANNSSDVKSIFPFKESPFYHHLSLLYAPTPLASRSNQASKEFCLFLRLSQSDIQALQTSDTSVHLRFCPYNTHSIQEDSYPKQLYIKINERMVSIPGYYPHLSTKAGYKCVSKAIDIKPYLQRNPPDKITVLWNEYHLSKIPSHYVMLHIVKSVTAASLLEKLKDRDMIPASKSKEIIIEKVKLDEDICASTLTISLICPLSKLRMQLPARGLKCKHLQCFDASMYLQMNEMRTTWTCAVCDGPIPFEELVVDELLVDIIRNTDLTEVQFDGFGKPVENDHPTAHEEEMDQGLCNGTLDPPREVIDLTETDDEEMEQRARPQYYYSQSMSTEAESTPNDRDLPNNELDSFHDILQSLRPGIRYSDIPNTDFLDEPLYDENPMQARSPRLPNLPDLYSQVSTSSPHASSILGTQSPDSGNVGCNSPLPVSFTNSSIDANALTPGSLTSGIDHNSSRGSTPNDVTQSVPSGFPFNTAVPSSLHNSHPFNSFSTQRHDRCSVISWPSLQPNINQPITHQPIIGISSAGQTLSSLPPTVCAGDLPFMSMITKSDPQNRMSEPQNHAFFSLPTSLSHNQQQSNGSFDWNTFLYQ